MHITKKDAVSVKLGLKFTEIIGVSLLFVGLGIAAIVKSTVSNTNDTLFLLCLGVVTFVCGIYAKIYLSKVTIEADTNGIRWSLPGQSEDIEWVMISNIQVQRKRTRGQILPINFLLLNCINNETITLPFNLRNPEEGEVFRKFISQYVKVVDDRITQ